MTSAKKSTPREKQPKPPKPDMPDTLARRVQFLREARDLTPRRLAELCALPLQQVEDIEAGIEGFLAPAIRSRLARALHVPGDWILEVERRPTLADITGAPLPTSSGEASLLLNIALPWFEILAQPTAAFSCPDCGRTLQVRKFQRLDLDDRAIDTLKIHCTGCLFRAEREFGV